MHWNRDHNIYTFPDLPEFTGKIVLAPGCFDLLHYSHIDYLQRARLLGDILIVALNSDLSVSRAKPGRPIIPQKWRARQIAALACVDAVVIFDQPTPDAVIACIRPRVVVAGAEWLGQNILQEITAEGLGQVIYLPEAEDHISTTQLIERLKTVPQEK